MINPAAYIATALLPLADSFGGHHDWGGGWWIVMALGMVAFWALLIGGGIWIVRQISSARGPDSAGEAPAALEILDRRLAEGAISIEEYEERRRTLLSARGEGTG